VKSKTQVSSQQVTQLLGCQNSESSQRGQMGEWNKKQHKEYLKPNV
jgi:hypothetical protein